MDAQNLVYTLAGAYVDDLSDTCPLPLVQKLKGYIRSRSLARLCDAAALYDPAYHGVAVLKALRQTEALFKKCEIFTDEERCTLTAKQNFLLAETICRITNRRLDFYYTHPGRLDPDMRFWLSKMEKTIQWFLSDHGSPSRAFKQFLDGLPSRIRVTSGATSTLSRRNAIPYLKLGRNLHCTPSAAPYLEALKLFYGYRAPRLVKTVTNRVELVPKNWKTHRTIACEPTGNVPLQLAFDEFVKERLHLLGCNLHDQSRNQELARLGSLNGYYATLDLSMASDTLAKNVVHLLFPEEWARYLTDVRSPCYLENGIVKTYAKFSSMGNGSTFAIETLVFASACVAVGAKVGDFVVYGDDIIIPTEHAVKLTRLLRFLGFRLNLAKSFLSGPFRESCGTDWFDGQDITPFYIRKLDDRKAVLSHTVNGLASVARLGGHLWELLRKITQEFKLPYVPLNDNSLSGVWIAPVDAYRLGVLRRQPKKHLWWTPRFRAILVKDETVTVQDSRALFLRYLELNRRDMEKRSPSVSARSACEVPTLQHKFVRKWVCWHVPTTGTPDYLYWWSDYLTS